MIDNSDYDHLKMCQLKAQGLMEEIDRRSTKPAFVCGKCRAKANQSEHLHNPLPISTGVGDNFWK